MSKEKEILSLVEAFLDERYSPKEFSDIEEKYINKIADLPYDYTNAIVEIAREFLISERLINDEYLFQLILMGLHERDSMLAFDLLKDSLISDKTKDKEAYVNLLLSYSPEKILTLFQQVILKLKSYDEYGGHAKQMILDKLIAWKIPLSGEIIKNALCDEAFRVKNAIISYISRNDLKDYSNDLIKSLNGSIDHSFFIEILRVLCKWNSIEALETIKKLLNNNKIAPDSMLRIELKNAYSKLNQ